MKAHLSLGNAGGLIAQLETGERILTNDTRKLAGQLRLVGVTAESITVTDWKTDPDPAPSSTEMIAIKVALRDLPPKTTVRMDALFQQYHETLKALADSDLGREPCRLIVPKFVTPLAFRFCAFLFQG